MEIPVTWCLQKSQTLFLLYQRCVAVREWQARVRQTTTRIRQLLSLLLAAVVIHLLVLHALSIFIYICQVLLQLVHFQITVDIQVLTRDEEGIPYPVCHWSRRCCLYVLLLLLFC